MTEHFRIIHFLPDLMSGWQVPVAAVVEGREGIQVIHAGHVPGSDCLGGRGKSDLLGVIIECLDGAAAIEDIARISRHIFVEEPQPLPTSVTNSKAWIVDHVLPRRAESGEKLTGRPRALSRKSIGKSVFLQHNVAKWVRPKFTVPSLAGNHGLPVPAVTHWVGVDESDDILLMEPLVPTRREDLFSIDMKEILYSLSFYSRATSIPGYRIGRSVAYMTIGGSSDRRRGALDLLTDSGIEVVDLAVASERIGLMDDIRERGRQMDMLRERHLH